MVQAPSDPHCPRVTSTEPEPLVGLRARRTPEGLPEFARYRPRAGHPDWPRLMREAKQLAAALRPGLERPERGASEVRRRARAYATAARNFIANRRLAKQGREDLRPLYFIWTMLRTCNFTCDYCDDHRGRKYPDLPNKGVLDTAQAMKLLEVMRTGTASVYFAGGEPTLRKDLPEITRRAKELDYYPIIINSNGSIFDRVLAKPAWRSWLADMDVIIVSLDALDVDLLNRMWVTKDAETVIKNLLMLRELSEEMGFKLMVNTVVQPGRIEHARDVLHFASDMGIWFTPVPMNVGPTINGTLKDDPEYRAFTELVLRRKREGQRITGSFRLNERLLGSAPLECRNALKPHIDFDGKLVWPCKASVNVDPEYVDVLSHESVDTLYAAACEKVDPTRFHGSAKNQCGANCNWAQNYTTDAYAHGLLHPTSLISEIVEFVRAR